MARAMQVQKQRASASKRAAKTTPRARTRTSRPAPSRATPSRTSAKAPTKKIVSRTANDRHKVKASPLARAVTRKNAPKATRVFIYTVATLAAVIITLMMVVVVFQTRLAETQLNIDVIEDQIAVEQARYNELRLERSSLREPSRLVAEATSLGMVPGTKTTFKNIDANAVAAVLVSMGGIDLEQFANTREPLKNYSAVKGIFGGGS
ncbi:MAG: hypothetical protein ACO3SP_05895 [Ilumatobacteraceae bacterium]